MRIPLRRNLRNGSFGEDPPPRKFDSLNNLGPGSHSRALFLAWHHANVVELAANRGTETILNKILINRPFYVDFGILLRLRGDRVRVHQQRLNARGRRTSSVHGDWHAWLPSEKAELYDIYTHYLETAYNVFGITLNEALELRRIGKLGKSSQLVSITPALFKRLAQPLTGLLQALAQHAKHYRTVSNAAPLSASNFQSVNAQRTARMNALLTRVLLSERSQFLHKISALEQLIGRLEEGFRVAAEELGMGMSLNPAADWRTLDMAHYDINTCFREAAILLKSFLLSIPDDQLEAFQKAADQCMRAPELPGRAVFLVQPRRMAASGGK